jgi:L-alanine-DL-glutamate epimerase-like enolase superfamily enzyme
MHSPTQQALHLTATLEDWPLAEVIRITGRTFSSSPVVHVTLSAAGKTGHGEGCGVYYKGDDAAHMLQTIEAVRPHVQAGLSRAQLQAVLPPGGARNALDCALWDLEAQLTGVPAWQRAGLAQPGPLLTTFTVSAEEPDAMARRARSFPDARAVKLKLLGDGQDALRVRAVREALPEVWLAVDANQGFTRKSLESLLPDLVACDVRLVEQPVPVGHEAQLKGLACPIPLAADESVQGLADVDAAAEHFQVVNIKLDKCGGLTEAMAMTERAKQLGMTVMVGNMTGTALSMAPATLVGQRCSIVDLDGPYFLACDRTPGVRYASGLLYCPDAVWGSAGVLGGVPTHGACPQPGRS